MDINKIRVSDKKLYNKQYNSCKYYVFYEHDTKYIPLKIILKDLVGYYNVYKDNDAKYDVKKTNFELDDDSLHKIYDLLEHIRRKLEIGVESCFYEDKRGEEYLETIVPNETCFKDNIIPNENIKYNCGAL